MTTGKQVTDRHIADWQRRGRWVVDNRGWLKTTSTYAQIALGAITKTIHHWTGDAFSRDFIKKVTGTDYRVDIVSPEMTVDDERDLILFYHELHRGHGWPGIAYPYMVFPSGRIHVNWNIGTMSYHAFSVNAYSIATCCPNSRAQPPLPEQVVSINHIWWSLFEETPEIPAAWSDLWCHWEAKRFDADNQTICPGPMWTNHVQRARSIASPSVPIVLERSEDTVMTPNPARDPGMPGVLLENGQPKIGDVVFPGELVTVEKVLIQGVNASGVRYWSGWDKHALIPWDFGYIPLKEG